MRLKWTFKSPHARIELFRNAVSERTIQDLAKTKKALQSRIKVCWFSERTGLSSPEHGKLAKQVHVLSTWRRVFIPFFVSLLCPWWAFLLMCDCAEAPIEYSTDPTKNENMRRTRTTKHILVFGKQDRMFNFPACSSTCGQICGVLWGLFVRLRRHFPFPGVRYKIGRRPPVAHFLTLAALWNEMHLRCTTHTRKFIAAQIDNLPCVVGVGVGSSNFQFAG